MNPMPEVTGATGSSSADPGPATGPIRLSPSKLVIDPRGTGTAAAVQSMSQLSLEPGSAPRALGQPAPMSAFDRSRHDQAIAQSDKARFQMRPERMDPRAIAVTRARADLLERHLDCWRHLDAVALFGAIGGSLAAAFPKRGMALSERLIADIEQASQSTKEQALFGLAQLHEAKGSLIEALDLYRCVLKMTSQPERRTTLSPQEIRNLDALHNHLKTLQTQAGTETILLKARDSLAEWDTVSAEAHLILAASEARTLRLEIACLQVAGDISYQKGQIEAAARYYEACGSRAALDPDEFPREMKAARESLKRPQSELDVATYAKAVTAGKDSQAVLDDLLLRVASDRWLRGDGSTATRLYDRIIPRLMERDDLQPAFDAIHHRLDIMEPDDPRAMELHLDIAEIYNGRDKYPDVLCCLERVLSSEQALPHLGRCLALATRMLSWYAAEDDVQDWCEAAATRAHVQDDVATLAGHIDDLLKSMPSFVESAVRDRDWEPLCDYVEALCNNNRGSDVIGLHAYLVDTLHDSNVDMHEVQRTLENHVRDKMPDADFVRLVVDIQMAVADSERLEGRFAEAASALLEAFQIDLPHEPAIGREWLDCAARVALVGDEPGRAAYLVEAAGLLARETEAAERSNEEQEDVDALEKVLEEELTPTEIDRVRRFVQTQAAKGPETLFADARRFLNEAIIQHGEESEDA
jgi:tetratricopeptide (TPR) repeat protein